MSRKKITEIIAILFIVLFVYTGVSKLTDVELFRVQIGQSPLLTEMAFVLAWAVPLVELVIAGLLVFEFTRVTGLYASLSIMVVFTVYIILVSEFSDYVPCSCGGVIQNMTWNQHLLFNIAFVLLAVTGLLIDTSKTNVSRL